MSSAHKGQGGAVFLCQMGSFHMCCYCDRGQLLRLARAGWPSASTSSAVLESPRWCSPCRAVCSLVRLPTEFSGLTQHTLGQRPLSTIPFSIPGLLHQSCRVKMSLWDPRVRVLSPALAPPSLSALDNDFSSQDGLIEGLLGGGCAPGAEDQSKESNYCVTARA